MNDVPRLPSPWEPLSLEGGTEATRTFGPLTLTVSWSGGEWFIEQAREGGAQLRRGPLPRADEALVRFVAEGADDPSLVFQPMLADRSVVARPEIPLSVVAGSTARLVVSTPLWVGIQTISGRKVDEVPSVILKDTWFGADTRVGEVCYAAKTAARRRVEDVHRTHTRAITVITIRNETHEPFRVSRVKLPLPHLALYVDRAGSFFTQSIRIDHTREEHVGAEAISVVPPEASGAVRVSAARAPVDRSIFSPFGLVLG